MNIFDEATKQILNSLASRLEGAHLPTQQELAIRGSESMDYFCQNDGQFKYGEWKKWYKDCQQQGKLLDPAPYKK